MFTLLHYVVEPSPLDYKNAQLFINDVQLNRTTYELFFDIKIMSDLGHHGTPSATFTKQITIDLNKYKGTVQALKFGFEIDDTVPHGPSIYLIEIPIKPRSAFEVMKRLEQIIARIAVEEDGENVTVLLHVNNTSAQGFDLTVPMEARTLKTQTTYLVEHSPIAKKIYNANVIKNRNLRNVDIYNSLSYLEDQVDLLTKLCLSILSEKNTNISEEQNELLRLLQLAKDNSAIDTKSTDKIEQEFIKNKRKIATMKKHIRDEEC